METETNPCTESFPDRYMYYAELFPLVQRQRQIPVWRLSQIITVPILGKDLCPRDRSLSQFYYILIKGLESVSVPVEKPA